jgi:hypothetical protein
MIDEKPTQNEPESNFSGNTITEKFAVKKDPSLYAYAADSKVVVSGSLFWLMKMACEKVINEEIKEYYEVKEDLEEQFDPIKTQPILLRTGKGMQFTSLLNELSRAHVENVDAGNAVLIEELKKPKISEVENAG